MVSRLVASILQGVLVAIIIYIIGAIIAAVIPSLGIGQVLENFAVLIGLVAGILAYLRDGRLWI